MTLRDGTRVHVMCHTENDDDDEFNPKSSPSTTNILGVSMSELMRRSDAIIRKTERHKQTRKRVRFGGVEYSQVKEFSEDEEGLIERRTIDDTTKHHQLWVDKHAPSSFSHLLSDDRTNREVLRALRAWDPYVFRRQAPKRPLMLQRGREQQEQESTNNKGDNENNKKSAVKDLRPDESSRVILLSGTCAIESSVPVVLCSSLVRDYADTRSLHFLRPSWSRQNDASAYSSSPCRISPLGGECV
jgi:chromosome transmission fidelity protein 18